MERIKISNFRSVKDSWDIELGPITFFTGKNNSGKSTVLKALMVLSDYCKSNNHLELSFRGESRNHHKVDSYKNAVNWDNFDKGDKEIQFSFVNAFKDDEGIRNHEITLIFEPLSQPNNEDERIQKGILKSATIKNTFTNDSFNMQRMTDGEFKIIADKDFFLEEEKTLADQIEQLKGEKTLMDLGTGKVQPDIDSKIQNLQSILEENGEIIEDPIFETSFNLKELLYRDPIMDKIFSASLRKCKTKRGKLEMPKEAHHISNEFRFLAEHLSPHRNNQSRLYKIDDLSNDINRLGSAYLNNPINRNGKAHQFFIKWLRYFDIGDNYTISLVHGDYILVQITGNNRTFNLIEKGFGAGQLFTMLLGIALEIDNKEKDSIIMIEEPEANLHPDFQSELADMFYEAYKSHGIRFIIETHSEYIIRRTQVIAFKNNYLSEHNGKPNPFKLYYFDSEGPYEMKYLENGKFDRRFGEGFYDARDKSAIELYKLSRRRNE